MVDEVVVVDSYSTHGTKRICQDLGVTFIQEKWQGYAATKNLANSKASKSWILSIDANEVLSPELATSLLHLKKNGLQS